MTKSERDLWDDAMLVLQLVCALLVAGGVAWMFKRFELFVIVFFSAFWFTLHVARNRHDRWEE